MDDTTFRYYFSDFFNPGVVRVLFTEGSFQDVDGAANLASEQQFAVVNNAPAFEFQIVGSYLQRHGFKEGIFGNLSNPAHVRRPAEDVRGRGLRGPAGHHRGGRFGHQDRAET